MDMFISSRGAKLLGGDGNKKHEVQGRVGTHWMELDNLKAKCNPK